MDDETKLETWLLDHPKIDAFLWNLSPRRARNWARRQVQNFEARREWKPGMFYLDHGSHPCVLIRIEDYDSLVGVSLVTGDIKGGCSIYHCGPNPRTRRPPGSSPRTCATALRVSTSSRRSSL